MSQGWVRGIVSIIAFAVVLVIGINIAGDIDFTPDPTSGVPVGFNIVIAVLAAGLLGGLIAYARDRVRADEAARFDHEPVLDPRDRAHPDRDRDQHHPRPDRRGRPQGPGLPRLDRHDPGWRPGRPDRRRAHRRPDEPDLDLRAAATAPVRVRRAVLHRRGRDRPGRRPRGPASASSGAGRTHLGTSSRSGRSWWPRSCS